MLFRRPLGRKVQLVRTLLGWVALSCLVGAHSPNDKSAHAEAVVDLFSDNDCVRPGPESPPWQTSTLDPLSQPDPSGPSKVRAQIDVMILFTGKAKAAYGQADIDRRIALSIAYMNEACNRSGVHARFRLIHQAETTWHQETPKAKDELYWLSSDTKVAELRDAVGADLVSLLVRDGLPTGGLAYLPGVYSIYNGNPFVFTHECGHNLGCNHDRANASPSYESDACNFGYSFLPPNKSDTYGDIMSYVGSQIQQFSNPLKYFLGAPTGIPEGHRDSNGNPDSADNVSVLNRTIPTAAYNRYPRVTVLDSPSLDGTALQFSFRVANTEAGIYTVEYTTDHETWTTLQKEYLPAENVWITDSNLVDAHRFYRIRSGRASGPAVLGYVKRAIPPGFSLVANPLEGSDNTLAALFPEMPEGTELYKWGEGLQRWTVNIFSFGEWEDPAMTLHPGEGAFLRNPTPEPFELRFVGEVNNALFNRVPTQLSIRSSSIPRSGLLSKVLDCVPFGDGGQVFTMRDGKYTAYTRDGGTWTPSEPSIELGEAFWCRNPLNAFMWQSVLPQVR